jgi:hypothetical protein
MLVVIFACLPQGRRNEPLDVEFLAVLLRSFTHSPHMQLILAGVTRISLLLALRGLCVCPLVMRCEDLLVIVFTSGRLPLRLTINVTLRAPRCLAPLGHPIAALATM